jgi:hypothetical protein
MTSLPTETARLITNKEIVNMTIENPQVDANFYLEDAEDAPAKHGTSVQSGWAAAEGLLKPKRANGNYPTEFRFSEELQLVRFLDNEPYMVYQLHWIDRSEGKKSFVCLGDECPLCTMLGDKPKPKFAFNILVLSDEQPNVQILTATTPLARQLQAANSHPVRGPLSKYYWTLGRQGTGASTQYSLERVKAADLAEEWDLDAENVEAIASSAVMYGQEAIYLTPRAELIQIARSLLN